MAMIGCRSSRLEPTGRRRRHPSVSGFSTEHWVWSYEAPYAAVSAIKEYLAFYPDRVDGIQVAAEG